MQVTEESAVAHCPLWKGPKISVAGKKNRGCHFFMKKCFNVLIQTYSCCHFDLFQGELLSLIKHQ